MDIAQICTEIFQTTDVKYNIAFIELFLYLMANLNYFKFQRVESINVQVVLITFDTHILSEHTCVSNALP